MAVATSEQRAQGRGLAVVRLVRSPHVVLLSVALAATLGLQFTTVGFYYYFDDYIPFSEMATESRWEYVWRLFASTDLTPNWRPLPGLLYLGSWEIAGMDPLPVRLVMIALHGATAALLYRVVFRTTREAWAGAVAALTFGLSPAYIGALSQVTTATQVMAGFFLVATLTVVIECALADDRRTANAWLAGAVALWVAAIGSHEGMAVLFPAFGLALLAFDREPDGRVMRAARRTAPFAAIGLATAVAFIACQCNEASDVWGPDYAWRQTIIYLGRLLYPVGLEPPWNVGVAHMTSAAGLAVAMLFVVLRGPSIARVGVAWVLLSLAPHVFIQYFTASRYLYIPSIGFALIVAGAATTIAPTLMRAAPRIAPAAGALMLAAVGAWYVAQTVRQDRHFADATADWRRFHDDVTRVFPRVPPGTRVMVIGGPFQKYDYQLHILPAFAETTWGDGVSISDLEPGSLPAQLALISDSPYVAEYRDGQLVPVHGEPPR